MKLSKLVSFSKVIVNLKNIFYENKDLLTQIANLNSANKFGAKILHTIEYLKNHYLIKILKTMINILSYVLKIISIYTFFNH